jgi:hypothetical protein
MIIEESRVFQVATFSTLHLHQSELDQNQVLLDVIDIADEVDGALLRKVRHRGIFKVGWNFTFAAAYNLVRLRNLTMQAT